MQKELVTSFLLAGAAIGAIGAGRVADRIGRQRTTLITAALFMASVLAAAFSPSFVILMAAQVVIGLGVGSASMVVPMYIGEAAPPRFRGALVSFNQLALSTGILVSYLVDYGLSGTGNWRLMFGLACVPAAALFLGLLLAVFQQITGINTVIYYAPTLLNNAGLGSSAALLANVANGSSSSA